MDYQKTNRRITFGVRLSGWLCLLPASLLLLVYQWYHISWVLWDLVLIVLYAAFTLATAPTARWRSSSYVMGQLLFALFFIGMVPALPLIFVYVTERKMMKK